MFSEFYLGTYAKASQPGILQVCADFKEKKFEVLRSIKNIENPSWVTSHPRKKVIYSVVEKTPDGGLAAFRLENGEPVPAGILPTGGSDPCHISLSCQNVPEKPSAKSTTVCQSVPKEDAAEESLCREPEYLFVSNYTSGSISVFKLDEEGIPTERTEVKQHTGHGTDPVRQEGPHVHFSQYVKDRLYVVDLGLDRIFRYTLDKKTGTLSEQDPPLLIPKGNGPRHFVFHPEKPEYLYVIAELTGNLLIYHEEEQNYSLIQKISTLPEEFHRENTSAAIRISADGKYLFVSNRGCDSITVLAVREDRTAECRQILESGGSAPRDIQLFGALAGEAEEESYLLAANQESAGVTAFRWMPESERLAALDMKLETEGKPVCIHRSLIMHTSQA